MEQRISFQDVPKGYMDALLGLGKYLYKSSIDVKLLDLIAYRVSQINGCAYCLDMHHKDSTYHGETEQRLHSLPAWRECPYYSEAERAALAVAEGLTTEANVDDAEFAELEKYFTKEQIADLAFAISATGVWNRLNKAFRTIPGGYQVNHG
ncbi:MAG TPA: carboxymuconolactone decarboxylase family protein [Puia sp.]|uniref:carboxymuconolactone decarboxylase family protein n=1 Tax=Puia sp. TaxID=2045100 RepID=UPI002BB8F9DD|nr:carboxymuconolactone decarboxylase family protein [Puia sp.]HVU98067.1 carboxymuconolactone decarboxylase family protein [Puia sp.]